MRWHTGQAILADINGHMLETRVWGAVNGTRPTLVLLHEGLGCTALWKGFPEKLAQATGCGVLVYSRAGYGASDTTAVPRPLDYMTQEAQADLPAILTAFGLSKVILIGHSDGASIAAILGGLADKRVRGLCLMAPHFFTEDMGIAAIQKARTDYDSGTLKTRLAKYHANPDNAFNGWCNAWLDPNFRRWTIEPYIQTIRVPVLALQGRQDAYGTLAQIGALHSGLYAPLENHVLENCGHAPHLEQLGETLRLVSDFVTRVIRIEDVVVKMPYLTL